MPRWAIRPCWSPSRSPQHEPEVLAPPPRRLDVVAVEARGQVGGPGRCRRATRAPRNSACARWCAPPRGRPGRGGPPRPRAAQAWGMPRGRPGGRACGPGSSRRRRQSPASSSAASTRSPAERSVRARQASSAACCSASFLDRPRAGAAGPRRPRRRWAWKVFSWSGPSSSTRYSGTPGACGAGQLLQAGLPVQAGAEGGRRGHQRVEQVVHEVPRPPHAGATGRPCR